MNFFITLTVRHKCINNRGLYGFRQLFAGENFRHYICFVDRNITFAKHFEHLKEQFNDLIIKTKQKIMKKKALFAAVMISTVLANAQEGTSVDPTVIKNRKGQEVLPKAGDIALGFNAVPVIDFLVQSIKVGAVSGTSAGTTSQFTQNAGQQIVGKYFLDGKTAIRARFGFNSLSTTQTNLVQDSKAVYAASLSGTPEDIRAASILTVEDKRSFVQNNLVLAVGYEKRRGYGRLVGFYGAEIGVSRTAQKESRSYGNEFSDQYNTVFTNNFVSGATSVQNPAGTATRLKEEKIDATWGIGARGFIGVEYFVFAKISIAAEYGFGYSFARSKNLQRKQDTYLVGQNGPTVVEEKVDTKSPSTSRGFGVDNGINSTLNKAGIGGSTASVSLLFHF